jgi:myo-inositol catabolism protein IolH
MKIALDPYMNRHLSLGELSAKVAELGYEWIELSPRGDFLEWFKAPRVFPDRIKSFKRALRDANVKIASLLPMYRWASNDDEERRAAVRHWKRAIQIAVEMGVDTMNSELGRGPHPDKGSCYCCQRLIPLSMVAQDVDGRRGMTTVRTKREQRGGAR